jgi:RNA polymerase sigma-70 factor, ECF subfamily
VYQVCYRFAGNHEDASDLSQEAFVRAWRGLKKFRGQAALSTWLYRIAVNVCLNRVSRTKPEMEPLGDDRFVDQQTNEPGSELIRGERALAVRRAIAELPDKQRATLILRTYHELSHQEIAQILGSSVGAVKANFFHALANLKKILGREP